MSDVILILENGKVSLLDKPGDVRVKVYDLDDPYGTEELTDGTKCSVYNLLSDAEERDKSRLEVEDIPLSRLGFF